MSCDRERSESQPVNRACGIKSWETSACVGRVYKCSFVGSAC